VIEQLTVKGTPTISVTPVEQVAPRMGPTTPSKITAYSWSVVPLPSSELLSYTSINAVNSPDAVGVPLMTRVVPDRLKFSQEGKPEIVLLNAE
jgi:hypothetical protein